MNNSVIDQVRNMIVDRLFLQVAPESIGENASLIDDFGVDSVALLELVVALEEEFGVRVEDKDFSVRNFESVAALANFIEKHR